MSQTFVQWKSHYLQKVSAGAENCRARARAEQSARGGDPWQDGARRSKRRPTPGRAGVEPRWHDLCLEAEG